MTLVGKPAPDFELEGFHNGDFATFKLADFKGKWTILLFYPLDFTFVCPTEVLAYSDAMQEFEALNAQVFGVSVDSKFVHKAWVETAKDKGGLGGELAYPLLADLNKEVATAYGLLHGPVALRGLVMINPEGTVVHEVVNFLPVGRNVKETLRTLKAFQFVSAHGDQVCPANWDEGAETMKATPDGMAKYLAAH